jgi:carbon-monoxide dehydrogenase large subunit
MLASDTQHCMVTPLDHAERSRPGLIGRSGPRLEDDRLLTGRGMYVGDVRLPRMVELAFVRSQLPHGRLLGVDLAPARAHPGVLMAVAAADLEGMRGRTEFPDWTQQADAFPLCEDRVRYVGAPIAAVVAGDRYAAEDAAELIWPEVEALPAVATIADALAPDAPRLFEGWPGNLLVDVGHEDAEADEPFERLRVVRGSYSMHRHAAMPIEPRGVVADFRDGRLTVYMSQQLPHIARGVLAERLGLPERSVRVIVPDVGGAFGGKGQIYPEDFVACWLAVRMGRPVRWVEDRYEHMVASAHSRDMHFELEAAVHDDGRIESLRGTIIQDVGSGQVFPDAWAQAFVAKGSLSGPYRIAQQNVRVQAVVTNKTPSGAYRGFGMPEATFATERLIDRIGAELGRDPLDVRRAMMLTPEDLPYTTPVGRHIDSGSHREAFERAVELGRHELESQRALLADRPSVRVGLGVATFVEGTAPSFFGTKASWGAHDAADIRFDPGGGVTVAVGISSFGQGVRTMVATVVAEELGLAIADVTVVMGDTDTAPFGLGSFGSRSTVVAAGAIKLAAGPLAQKGKAIAAHMLEAAPEDLDVADGRFTIRGVPDRGVSWADVARAALAGAVDLPPGIEPGLSAVATYNPPNVQLVADERGKLNGATTFTNATHAAVVAVDVETGALKVLRYVVVHDCGRVINPLIVAGQVIGGVVQGVGGVLLEELEYSEDGTPKSTTFMEYLLPTACEAPHVVLEEIETPAPDTAFGVKGVGEAGIIGPAPAVAGAVEHALEEYAIPHITATPITPERVMAWISAPEEAAS